MVQSGEIEHGRLIAHDAERIWNWSSPAGRKRALRRAALIAHHAGLRPGMRVLELGCGSGLFTESFARTGAAVTAIDISSDLLDVARNRTAWPLTVNFALADAEDLPFPNEHFDAVVGSSVLHHLRLLPATAGLFRVLRPGGRISFAEPNMLNPQIALQRSVPVLRRWAGESPEETAFIRWSLAHDLRRQGFEEVRIEPFDFLHPAVPRRLVPWVSRVGTVIERIPLLREIAGSLIIHGRKCSVASIRTAPRESLLLDWRERARRALTLREMPLPA